MKNEGITKLAKIGVVVEVTNRNQETQMKHLCRIGGVSFPQRQDDNFKIEGNKKIKIYPVFYTFQYMPKFSCVFSCISSDMCCIPEETVYMDFKSFSYNILKSEE